MMNSNHIKQLTKKFFDGDTTLEEEQTLYAYFASDDIEPSLMPLRDMFRDLAALHDMAITADISTSNTTASSNNEGKEAQHVDRHISSRSCNTAVSNREKRKQLA
ncbi:MAG: hypothetical protein IJK21_03155 [Prevotella sp.]|nr:hypothetical protein [Prevotella sp.]